MISDIELLKKSLNSVISNKLDIAKDSFDFTNYKDKKAEYYKKTIEFCINRLKSFDDAKIREFTEKIEIAYKKRDFEGMLKIVNELDKLELKKPEERKLKIRLPKLPSEISKEIAADVEELERCINSGCYRSAVILCGRILETALHRKYYEISGKDLLETSPGIGLGNLIAKLKEKEFNLQPGLSEQIHLINQIRIYSVHKKKEFFYPTKEQAHAMMLYTLDVLNKLFNN